MHPGAQFGWDKFESRIKQNGEFGKVTRVLKVLQKARNKEVVFEFLIDVTKNLDKKLVIGYKVKSTKVLLKNCYEKCRRCVWAQASHSNERIILDTMWWNRFLVPC